MGGLTMKHPFDYRGKSVFIAGGSSGINLGIAHAFAAAGAKVAIASRSQNRIDNVVVELQAHGDEVAGYWADVRDYAAFAAVLEQAHQRFGDFDVLISGAAGNFVAPALGMSSNGFKAVMDIDLLGTYNVLRAAHPYLKKPGAAIINISAPQGISAHGLSGARRRGQGWRGYGTRVLAIEWAPDGIRVNSIAPGRGGGHGRHGTAGADG